MTMLCKILFFIVLLFSVSISAISITTGLSKIYKTDFVTSLVAVNLNNASQCAQALYNQSLKVIDASGHVPPGDIGLDNSWSEGDYDECLHTFTGMRYLLIRFTLASAKTIPIPLALNLGVCLPQSCTDAEITSSLQQFTNKTSFKYNLTVSSGIQPINYQNMVDDNFAMGGLYVFIVIGVFTILATLRDALPAAVKVIWLKPSISGDEENDDDLRLLVNSTENINFDSARNQSVNCDIKETKMTLFFGAFSIYRNLPKLMNLTESKNAIKCFNGIRCLSMMWVLFGHTFLWSTSFVIENVAKVTQDEKSMWFQIITNGVFSVDSFFFSEWISGLSEFP